jgi:hypothetical protein
MWQLLGKTVILCAVPKAIDALYDLFFKPEEPDKTEDKYAQKTADAPANRITNEHEKDSSFDEVTK